MVQWGQWYEESEHPRGQGGRWTAKGGGGVPSDEREPRTELDKYGLSSDEQDMVWGWKSGVDATSLRESDSFGRTLRKFPLRVGTCYRGLSLQKAKLAKLKPGVTVRMAKHSSASNSRTIANVFSDALRGQVPVLFKIEAKTARKLPLLYSDFGEREVILLKGSHYKVTDVNTVRRRSSESDELEERTVVTMKEIEARGGVPMDEPEDEDEVSKYQDIINEGGTEEYRNRDTKDLEKDVAEIEKEYDPKLKRYFDERLGKLRKELAWRDATKQIRVLAPSSIGDVTETHQITKERLEEYSTPIQVGDIEYRIGQGVGYAPLGGGEFVMMDGLIVVGPRNQLLKPASDIPELEAEIERQYRASLSGEGGDFAKAKPTTRRDVIGRLMYGYKSPLTGSTYADFVDALAKGYFAHGKVEGRPAEESELDREQREMKKVEESGDAKHIAWMRQWYKENYTGVRKIQAMMGKIREAEWKDTMVGQDAVDQFAAFARDTQRVLAKTHPGKNTLTLYRGVAGDYAKEMKRVLKNEEEIEIDVRNVDSWTSDEAVARKFAGRLGAVIKKEVPIKEILFSHEGPRGSGLSASDYLFGGEEESEHLWGHSSTRMRVKRSEVS